MTISATVAGGPVADERPPQQVDVVVGDLTAAVIALVHDDGFFVGLRKEIALEIGVSHRRRIGNVDISDATIRRSGHLADVAFDPVAISEALLVRDRDDVDVSRTGSVGAWSDGDLYNLLGRFLEPLVEVLGSVKLAPVDFEDIVANNDTDAGLRKRRAELSIPIEPTIDLLNTIATVIGHVVGAEKASRYRLGLGARVAARDTVMSDSELAAHPLDDRFKSSRLARCSRKISYFSPVACQSAPCILGS